MRKVLIVDTGILCVWLKVPGKEICGPSSDRWNFARVDKMIKQAKKENATLVLPLATIIETGNHISQAPKQRRDTAQKLAGILAKVADELSPWAAFSDQSSLWSPEKIKALAASWPDLAAQKLSLGDATISEVAQYYSDLNCEVKILTGDRQLQSLQPTSPVENLPRRRRKR